MQLNKLLTFAATLVSLLMSVECLASNTRKDGSSNYYVRLSFVQTKEGREVVCRTRSGQTWRARLSPDYDINRNPVVAELQLTKDGSTENMLYNGKNFHGIQPFIFSARDFSSGVHKSVYGPDRKVFVAALKDNLRIHVFLVDVASVGDTNFFRRLEIGIRLTGVHRPLLSCSYRKH